MVIPLSASHLTFNVGKIAVQIATQALATFDALKQVGYQGWLVVEAFGLALPALVAATKIWRRMFDSEEQLARGALAFMKKEVAKRW